MTNRKYSRHRYKTPGDSSTFMSLVKEYNTTVTHVQYARDLDTGGWDSIQIGEIQIWYKHILGEARNSTQKKFNLKFRSKSTDDFLLQLVDILTRHQMGKLSELLRISNAILYGGYVRSLKEYKSDLGNFKTLINDIDMSS